WIFRELNNRYNLEVELMPLDENFQSNLRKYVENSLEDLIPSSDSSILTKLFFLVFEGEILVGMGGLRGLSSEIGEIKRMYVLPEYRKKGYGKEILHYLILQGQQLGFSTLRLDMGIFLTAALHLYHSVGFYEIEEYPETEIPAEFRPYWLFLEKKL
ncbi:MAG: GNAT family N-acetyltransferase, partial [Promethearchaeota archaeon]